MPDLTAQLAHRVLSENLHVRKGETVVIESWTHSVPYTGAFVREARKLGAHPTVLYEDEAAWWDGVGSRTAPSTGSMTPAERAALAAADVFVYFWGPADRPRLETLPKKVQDGLNGFNENWYKLARKTGLRGCRMTVGQATEPAAKQFGLNAETWRQRLVAAGAADADAMAADGERIARALTRGTTLRLTHPNGTDLTLALDGVHTRVDVGRVGPADFKRPYGMLTNNPSGQVFVAIDRSAASGMFVSNRTIYLGPNKFDGMRWRFEDGKLVEHRTGTGRAIFEKNYRAAPKERDLLGYLSVGLNPKSRDLPPCEDTEAGSVLVGIGANGIAGGSIKIPFLGFGLLGGGTLTVDGTTLAKGGRIR
jgi:leucyl aminopeptidase (aminopeptidase T)